MSTPITLLVAAVDAVLALAYALDHSYTRNLTSLLAALGMLGLAVVALGAGAMA